MKPVLFIIFFGALFLSIASFGQTDSDEIKDYISRQVNELAGRNMHGRGYVFDGKEMAATYIRKQFEKVGLQTVGGDSYLQEYYFPVNTFPGNMSLNINDRELRAGVDYIIDPGAPSFDGDNMEAEIMDLGDVRDVNGFKKAMFGMDIRRLNVLRHVDTMCKMLGLSVEELPALLPEGSYIIPCPGKLIWEVTGEVARATVFFVCDSILPQSISGVSVHDKAVLIPKSLNDNIIAVAPGDVKDTFIVFTAHYDHLGMMGNRTMFPGASDNASGTAMLLWLSRYFATHPQHYSVLFMAFSGEEAGLLGSEYYVNNPIVPLVQMKFLINIDIMGDATDGITVVNATEFPKQFALLQHINDEKKLIPVIKSRGKAHNSDHWNFTENGVPSFFFYSNGGAGYYHDVFDESDKLTFNDIAGVAHLIIDFVSKLR